MSDTFLWGAFAITIIAMLAIDLGVLNRRAHAITVREATLTSAMWIAVSLAFNAFVWFERGSTSGLEFLTGYLIEKALSVDNLFVFLVIFAYFHVSAEFQHRVLFWGILGAIILRGLLIGIGAALIHQFEWLLYIFGIFLLYTAIRLWSQKGESVHPEKNPVVNLFRKFMPVTKDYDAGRFLKRIDGRLFATPLLIVLIVVETTDLAFALDSIPAIFAVTTDAFIVFTSNIFAILGLRALFFLLAGLLGMFRYLQHGLSLVLGFIGVKMLVRMIGIDVEVGVSLAVIAIILTGAVLASIISARREGRLKLLTLAEAEEQAEEMVEGLVDAESESPLAIESRRPNSNGNAQSIKEK
jgi:tellurite resistance protein TerC